MVDTFACCLSAELVFHELELNEIFGGMVTVGAHYKKDNMKVSAVPKLCDFFAAHSRIKVFLSRIGNFQLQW